MIEVKVKKLKFSDKPDVTGASFSKTDDIIVLNLSDKATSVLDKLKKCWEITCPDMVSWIEDPGQLKLVLMGKTVNWDSYLSDYKLK